MREPFQTVNLRDAALEGETRSIETFDSFISEQPNPTFPYTGQSIKLPAPSSHETEVLEEAEMDAMGVGYQQSFAQGPGVQLLLWQVLQQLQSSELDRNICPSLLSQVNMLKMKQKQERMNFEHMEEEKITQVSEFKSRLRISELVVENLKLELEVKTSRLETLKKELESEKDLGLKLTVELDNQKQALLQERKFIIKLEQEFEDMDQQLRKEKLKRNLTNDELEECKNQVMKEKDLKSNLEKELEKERKRSYELEVSLLNETKTRLDAEHNFVKEIHSLKDKIQLLSGQTCIDDTSRKECEDVKRDLKKEKKKTAGLLDELSQEKTKVNYLELKLVHEQESVAGLKDYLSAEKNETAKLNVKLDNEMEKNVELGKKLETEGRTRKELEDTLKEVKRFYVSCDDDKLTRLQKASRVCDFEAAKSLLEKGASASELTTGNSTVKTSAVHIAVQAGCDDIVGLFAQNKSLLLVLNQHGATPLHEASYYSKLSIMKLLLDQGAPINYRDKADKTPLDYAVDTVSAEAMKLLIDRGAITFYRTTPKPVVEDDGYPYYYDY
ncbi:uncharacterized protein MCAP_0864-like [Periplaneta americana]|uniref:uncharacterized protein MCAP_0864-like n=1 Tax=Periplaneta americana TaxID=6978 RepID=UPI0037E902FF